MCDPLLVLKFVMFLKSKYFKVYLFVKIPSPHPWRDPVPPPSTFCSYLCAMNMVVHLQKKNANRNDVQFLILIVGTLTWITVKTSKSLTARAGHVALFLPVEDEEKEKEEIAVFGGGDNAGGYFNDLVVFSPSTC